MDQTADLLVRIKNAASAKRKFVDVRWSVLSQQIVEVMMQSRFVEHFLVKHEDGKSLMRVFLGYTRDSQPIIRQIKKISNPGRRVYIGYRNIPRVFNGMGDVILTTSQGVLNGHEARKKKVGGEVLCYVW